MFGTLIIIENFLDYKEFENFKKNFNEIGKIGKDESFESGDIYIQRNSINTNRENKLINLFLKSKKILNILSAVERRDFNDSIISDDKFIIDRELFKNNYLKLSIGKKRHIKIQLI